MHCRRRCRPSPYPLLLRALARFSIILSLVIPAAQLTVRPYLVHSNEALHHEVPLQVYLLLHELLDFAQVLLHVLHLDASVHYTCVHRLVMMALKTERRGTAPTAWRVVSVVDVHAA